VPDLVSVIVPTRNSAGTLKACLRSVRAQTYSAVELIVVDNYSSDGTAQLARSLANAVIEAGPERSAQRNIGGRSAKGEFVAFIDSDMVLEPTVLAEAVARAVAGADAVVIPEISVGDGFWARCKTLERSCYIEDPTIEAARFFTRDAFLRVDGYDEQIVAGPEDWDIHERIRAVGGQIDRTAALIRHDEGRLRLRETVAAKFYYGKATAVYIKKHPELARKQLRLIRPAFIRHWRRLARHPVTTAGMFVQKACELGAGALGIAFAYASFRRRPD
jgi:glycosyltransferase involved in cell wall biosynthesis